MADKQQQQQQDSVRSGAFDDEYGDDPDDFVANAKPTGGAGSARTSTNKSSKGVYTAKHTRIKEAQRETRNTKQPPKK